MVSDLHLLVYDLVFTHMMCIMLNQVQKLISASPHLVLEDSAFFDKPVVKPLPSKKRTLDYSIKVISNDPKKKRGSENPSLEKEVSAENTVDKASLSSPQNRVSPPSLNGPPPPPCFSHPQTHQWLVPVMSPTEGLVYKPYPGSCGPPPIGNFPTPPMYGIPPPPHQYPMSSFPPFGPHGYFSPYAMPIMTTPTFSGSSVDQTNPPHVPTPTVPIQKDMAVRNGLNSNAGEETEVQGSSVSCPSERETSRQGSNGRRNMLPLFPTAPAKDVGPEVPVAEKPSRVIKVVPHNSMTASESAARIFRSIQEERKQFDAV